MKASVLIVAMVLAVSMSGPQQARADDPAQLTFTSGTGPLLSSLVDPDQLAALPEDVRIFLETHRVGDTWTLTVGDPLSPHPCSSGQNSDWVSTVLFVTAEQIFFPQGQPGWQVGWDSHGQVWVQSCRWPHDPTLTMNLQVRHHDEYNEFPTTVPFFLQTNCVDAESYCYYLRDGWGDGWQPFLFAGVDLTKVPPGGGSFDIGRFWQSVTFSYKYDRTSALFGYMRDCRVDRVLTPPGRLGPTLIDAQCNFDQPLP